MKKVLLGTFLGFFLFGGGLAAGYFAIENIRSGGSPFLVLGSVLLCGGGMVVLYKSGRMDTFRSKIKPMQMGGTTKGQTMIEKNQQIVKEWNQTNDNRDKLKILEAAGRAGIEEKK